MPQFKTTAHLLWGKCPFSKWHRHASNPRPLQKHAQATAPRACPLAGGSTLCIVAVCLAKCIFFHNNLSVLEDGTSRLELFSSIWVGSNLKHVHTFMCPVFTLQNVLVSGSQLPCWSPRARLGLNLGPSPMQARNVYLILNLVTGCVSPQYHCCFDNFFKTMHHGAPDVSGTICWQQLANLDPTKMVFSKVSMPNQHSVVSLEMPSDEESHIMSNLVFKPNTFDTMSDDSSISEALQVSKNSHTPWQNWSSHTTDEVTPVEPTVTAGTSQHGRVCTCHKEWPNPCPNGVYMETKVCTTWHLKPLLVIQMKTSSATPIFNFKSGWETLLHSMQKWWVTSCIFNKRWNSPMQRNLSKRSSRKSMDTWTPTIGCSRSKAKFLRTSKLSPQYGPYDANMILQQTKSSYTRPVWTYMVERKST